MPRKISQAASSSQLAQPQISAQLLEELIPGPVTKEQFENIFQNFKRAFIERALNAEMSHHLGYTSGQVKPEGATNHPNGSSPKVVLVGVEKLLKLA
jgi:putative transposase